LQAILIPEVKASSNKVLSYSQYQLDIGHWQYLARNLSVKPRRHS